MQIINRKKELGSNTMDPLPRFNSMTKRITIEGNKINGEVKNGWLQAKLCLSGSLRSKNTFPGSEM